MTAESQRACEVSQGMSHFASTVQFCPHGTQIDTDIKELHRSAVIHFYPADSFKAPMICNAALKSKVYKHSCCHQCLGGAIQVQKPSLKVPESRRAAC